MQAQAEFDAKHIQAALDAAAKQHASALAAQPEGQLYDPHHGELSITAQCVTVTVENNQVCLNIPAPLNRHVCLNLPITVPNGTAASACLSVCTIWGIPSGIKITVTVAGNVILTQSFGRC